VGANNFASCEAIIVLKASGKLFLKVFAIRVPVGGILFQKIYLEPDNYYCDFYFRRAII